MKVCSKCKVLKDITEFFKDISHSNGIRSACKSCELESRRKYQEQYRKENKIHINNLQKKWYHLKRDYKKEYQKQYKRKDRLKTILNNAKARAKLDSVEIDNIEILYDHLKEKYFEHESGIPTTCEVFNIPLFFSDIRTINTPSLDRINNECGYVIGNIRIISLRANILKSDGTADEHFKIAHYIKSHLKNE